jgi:hypothetical protein
MNNYTQYLAGNYDPLSVFHNSYEDCYDHNDDAATLVIAKMFDHTRLYDKFNQTSLVVYYEEFASFLQLELIVGHVSGDCVLNVQKNCSLFDKLVDN